MSWRDDYQYGSFRGVPFITERHDTAGGQRLVVHEFPGRDEHANEELGRKPRRITLEVFVAGPSYFAQRDALVSALEEGGPGLLIHPWLGAMDVNVEDWTVSESTDEGGIARFSLDLVAAAAAEPAEVEEVDGSELSIDEADSIIENAPDLFELAYSVAGFPGFVEDAAAALIGDLASFTGAIARVGGNAGAVLRAFESGLAILRSIGLVRQPRDLGRALRGMVTTVGQLDGSPRRRIATYQAMLAYRPIVPVPRTTPARTAQGRNADAILHIYRVCAAAELARTIAQTSFGSQEEALAVRNGASVLLGDLAIAQADVGEDDRARQYRDIRAAIVRDLGQRAPQLPALYDYTPRATEPALVVANRLYGHALATVLGADMVARNRLAHPGFLTGGVAVKVVTNG